ncbi:glycoside hydrolase family 172 protein [Aeoliella sp.]|uniref:glycoside hydrolase family 172 protein n=1 Tax=Aeoliella sp. TaxID=2795800 RepID=UPI003CCB93A0
MNSLLRSYLLVVVALSTLASPILAQGLADLARPMEGRSMRATSAHRVGPDGKFDPNGELDPNSNWDNKNLDPGKTRVLMEANGPGVITHIWMTFLGPQKHTWAKDGSANHQEMLLRIYYDGSDRPAVEAPVGDFFANCFGKRAEVISVPVVVEDADSYNCFWHMPFRKSIRIEVENQSEKPVSLLYYNIDWIKKESIADDIPYFYAQYKQEYPVKQGSDYVILDTEGKGHYVGTVLAVRSRSPSWFGEGDEKVYIDGEEKPSIWGTGTEDYFLSAWGLQTTSTPYFGTPYFDQWGIVGGHTSAYRWHVQDPWVFNKSIKVTIEHFGWMSPDENPKYVANSWNERQDDYSSVAFWYQTGTPTFKARAPHAKERTLPSIERETFHATAMLDNLDHGHGHIRRQDINNYPEGHVFFKPESQDEGWIEIPFTVKKKEPLRLLINATRAEDYGKYRATLDGVAIGGTMDFYKDGIDEWEYHLLDFWPEPGEHVLRLECVGQNHKSSGNYLGLESVRLRERRPRVIEMGHDKDKDWKKEPKLYD